MDSEEWSRIESIFSEVVTLDATERGNYLERACRSDDELKATVEAMLSAIDTTHGAAIDTFARDVTPDFSDWLGRRIGPYCLVERIGEGGMGVVFAAERADDAYQQQVAIKLLHSGLISTEARHRFESERQILASLDHPNIAKLLDGGTTSEGIPYLVMEYVDGEPLHQYCDKHRLSVTERLWLFQQICSAVQQAHENFVVHRDIKPANILVTAQGAPKLLDFGIAKLLDPADSFGTMMVTRGDMRPMTPRHASPEQLLGDPITTASDVYALGVLLYQLLTGRFPYNLTSPSPLDVARVICNEEPLKPSASVLASGSQFTATATGEVLGPVEIAKRRGSTAKALKNRLAGDLDNIALAALRKNPTRRYTTVRDLSDDIYRHLDNTPVLARPKSFGYRVQKFISRHPVGVATTLGVSVLVSILVFYFLIAIANTIAGGIAVCP